MGKLFVIEGLDGSGKETQSKLLYKRLYDDGYNIRMISYPRYEKESSALVKMYLRGDFGNNPDEISPYISSSFFAVDRYASYKCELEDFYKEGGIVLADRYTTSNMVHQGGKIDKDEELTKFLDWLWNLEFEIYSIPVPDRVYFLDIPLQYVVERIEKRPNKITQDNIKDIHEASGKHLYKAFNNALKLVEMYNWKSIQCIEGHRFKTIEEINEEIYKDIITKIVREKNV